MNLQQPTTNMHAAGGVANNAHRVSTSADRFSGAVPLREVSVERKRSTSPLTAQPGCVPSNEKYQDASSVRAPSLAPKKEIASSFSTPTGHLATTSSGDRTVSLAPSVISKASTLSSQKGKFNLRPDDIKKTETVRPDITNTRNDLKRKELSSSSSSSTNEVYATDGSASVPTCITYVTASLQSTETIFTARKKELHFSSDVFRQDYQKWLLDDDSISDDDDSDEDQDNYQHDYTEYSGRTNFVKRNGAFRKSHEIGPLSFACILDLDDTNSSSTTDSDDE